MNALLLATKGVAALTLIALFSTETMGGLASDVKEAVLTSADASVIQTATPDARVDVGHVLYTAKGERLGAIRAVRRNQGDYTVIYLANAVFMGEDVSVVNGRVQLRDVDLDLGVFAEADPGSEIGTETRAASLAALPR